MNISPIVIVAEAGVNHNGSLNIAKRMIDVAADSGVDFIKFQTFKTENLVTRSAEKAKYQKNQTDSNESQFEMIKKLELSEKSHFELIDYCNRKGIQFLSTAFDQESIEFVIKLNMPFFKIPSGEINNLPFLRNIGRIGKPVVLSTGMANLNEVKIALEILIGSGTNKEEITILHCSTDYPTKMENVNLKAMITMKEDLGVKVGYSDHTLGIEIPVACAAMGATLIEKHFTLDRSMLGPDHSASLEPNELKTMVKQIRNIEKALGDGIKIPNTNELRNISVVRKSIVAKKNITKGETFSVENLTVKRPGLGISPMEWDNYIGRKSDKDYKTDELIK